MAVRTETPLTDNGDTSRQAATPTVDLTTRWARRLSRNSYLLILLLLLIVALAVRIYGQQWDDATFSHPDERFIYMQMSQINFPSSLDLGSLISPDSPLNPKSFNYGSLTFYLLRGISVVLSDIGKTIGVQELVRLTSFDGVSSVGRTVSALFDLGTIVVIYLIGQRLYGRQVGLLAAAFATFAVIHIQLSHFYAADTLMTFFITLAVFASVFVMRSNSYRYAIFAGITISLALASKVSALPVLAPVGVALLLRVFSSESQTGGTTFRRPSIEQVNHGVIRIAITAAASVVTLAVVQPYAFLDAERFFRDVSQQSEMVRGIADLPYTRQYIERTAYLYFLQNFTLFGLGLPLGLATIGGSIYAIIRLLRTPNGLETAALSSLVILSFIAVLASSDLFIIAGLLGWIILLIHLRGSPRRAELLLLSLIIPYFLITGSFHAKFMRYLLPITPVLLILAAEALWRLRKWAGQWKANYLEPQLVPAIAVASPVAEATTVAGVDDLETPPATPADEEEFLLGGDVDSELDGVLEVPFDDDHAVIMEEELLEFAQLSSTPRDSEVSTLDASVAATEDQFDPGQQDSPGTQQPSDHDSPHGEVPADPATEDEGFDPGLPQEDHSFDELSEVDDSDRGGLVEERDSLPLGPSPEPATEPEGTDSGLPENDQGLDELSELDDSDRGWLIEEEEGDYLVDDEVSDDTDDQIPVDPGFGEHSTADALADDDTESGGDSDPQSPALIDDEFADRGSSESPPDHDEPKQDEQESVPPDYGSAESSSLPAPLLVDEPVIGQNDELEEPGVESEVDADILDELADDQTDVAEDFYENDDDGAEDFGSLDELEPDTESQDDEERPTRSIPARDESVFEFSERIDSEHPDPDAEGWESLRQLGIDDETILGAQSKGLSPALFLGDYDEEAPSESSPSSDYDALWEDVRRAGFDEESIQVAHVKGLSPHLFLGDEAMPGQQADSGPGTKFFDELSIGTGESAQDPDLGEPAPLPAIAFRYPWLGRAMRTGLLMRLATVLIALVVATTALYALAFTNMYSEKHTSTVASEWVYQNMPPGSAFATEHWEEGMPKHVTINGQRFTPQTSGYRELKLNLYEPDTTSKYAHVLGVLKQADYIIFFSNRLYGTIPRLPERYPLTSRYYTLLFGEQLGFELDAAFATYPNLFGIHLTDDTFSDPGLPTPRLLSEPGNPGLQINLGRADESFTVYDHPKVLVFKKTRQLSDDEYRDLFGSDLVSRLNQPASAFAASKYKSLTLNPVQRQQVESGGTFAEMFDRDSIANQAPVIIWMVLVWLIGIAALPLAFSVFRNLPDRGIPLSRALGVLLLAWLVWWFVNLGVTNNRLAVVGVFIAMLAAGLYAIYLQRGALMSHWRDNRRLILIGEVVFLGAFMVDLAIRLLNPDLWHPARGGEKPMDIAYLMAVIKTPVFPPYDPWFAGGYLNYYYFGQIVVGTLIKLSGILPTTAYNLAVPLLFALAASSVFSVVYNLVSRADQKSIRRPVLAGLLGAALATTLGNLGGFGQVIDQLVRTGGTAIRSDLPGLGSVAAIVSGIWSVTLGGREFPIRTDWYWASTRVLEGTINEFPFFTFLYADLHAHMIALPFTILALAVALNFVKSEIGKLRMPSSSLPLPLGGLHFATTAEIPRFSIFPINLEPLSRLAAMVSVREIVLLGTAGLVVGSLYPMNSWDYPTYLGLVSLAILAPWYFASNRSPVSLGLSVARILVVFIFSWFLFYLPFSLNFQSFYSGIRWIPDKSNVGGYLVIHGVFLVALVSYLLLDLIQRYRRSGALRMVGMMFRWWDRVPRAIRLARHLATGRSDVRVLMGVYAGLALLLIVAVSVILKAALAGIALALLIWVAFAALQRDRGIEESWALALFGTGLALTIFTELAAIEGDIGRMNTVFKFYMQIWMLWSVATVVALVSVRRWLADTPPVVRRIWLTVLVAMFVCASVYPVASTYARVRDRFNEMPPSVSGSLDGTAYMETAVYVDRDRRLDLENDLLAIEWLQDNIKGSPAILEANTPLYRWGSRISIYTGLPTVIGWDWHQTQQRFGYRHLIEERLRDVQAMFEHAPPDRTMDLLNQYAVSLIYLGDLERAYYPGASAKFSRLAEEGRLRVEYDHLGVKIYRVIG